MKVLIINLEKGWRGGERQTLFNAIGLTNQNIDIEVICRKNSDLEKKLLENNIKILTVNSYFQLFIFLIKNSKNVDFILCQTSKSLTLAFFSSFFHNAKLLLFRRLDFVPKGWFTKLKYKSCKKIFCVSEAVQVILNNININNTIVIPDCITPQNINKERAKKLIEHLPITDKKIIGTTAALVNHKDPITMIYAINELRKRDKNIVFVHFGEGKLEAEMRTLIQKLDLENHYFLMGFVKNVEDIFSVLDVFVMSSEEEGMGSSVLDAFLYKVPVVSTNAGGLCELVQNRGIVVEKKNPTLLADGIYELLLNENLKQKNIENAYNYVIDNLNINSIHQKLSKILYQIQKDE